MNQQEFNLTHPVSHTRDPSTSKAAERSITDSGMRRTHNQMVAWLVSMYPGKTASELANYACTVLHTFYGYREMGEYFRNMGPDKSLFEIRRRLSDMKGIHTLQGEARKGLLNKKEVTWYPK